MVLCQLCGKKPAVIHFTEIGGGKVRHLHLCEDCAKHRESGLAEEGREEQAPQARTLLEVLQKLLAADSEDVALKCAQCGQTYADFRSSGRLGCGHCYDAFVEKLEPMLKRIHGRDRHKGKVPECMDERVRLLHEKARLKQELTKAIEGEAFEEAARLRDSIKVLDERIAPQEEPSGSA